MGRFSKEPRFLLIEKTVPNLKWFHLVIFTHDGVKVICIQ